MARKPSATRQNQVETNARFNRLCYERLGTDGGEEIVEKLEKFFEPPSLLKKDGNGRGDPLATGAACGAYELLSLLKFWINKGSRNE